MSQARQFKTKHANFKYSEERVWLNGNANQIAKDIRRTLVPAIHKPDLQEAYYTSVNNILNAYSNFNKNVGYVQGMNIIASCVLYNVCNSDYSFISTYEEQAFWLFTLLLEQYSIKLCFSANMRKVFELSDSLEFNLQKNQGSVFNHINRSDVR